MRVVERNPEGVQPGVAQPAPVLGVDAAAVVLEVLDAVAGRRGGRIRRGRTGCRPSRLPSRSREKSLSRYGSSSRWTSSGPRTPHQPHVAVRIVVREAGASSRGRPDRRCTQRPHRQSSGSRTRCTRSARGARGGGRWPGRSSLVPDVVELSEGDLLARQVGRLPVDVPEDCQSGPDGTDRTREGAIPRQPDLEAPDLVPALLVNAPIEMRCQPLTSRG